MNKVDDSAYLNYFQGLKHPQTKPNNNQIKINKLPPQRKKKLKDFLKLIQNFLHTSVQPLKFLNNQTRAPYTCIK